jgi:polyisoprenoid-binding protein YceI
MNYATLCALMAISSLASASPVTYTIDPNHTHPEFEADHLGGVSIWRGLFKRTSGTIILDAAAQTGALDVAIDVTSVEFGNDKLNEEAVNSSAPPIFEAQKYPTVCGADAVGTFNRADFGITVGQRFGFKMQVTLHIQVEAIRAE